MRIQRGMKYTHQKLPAQQLNLEIARLPHPADMSALLEATCATFFLPRRLADLPFLRSQLSLLVDELVEFQHGIEKLFD